MSHSSNPLEQKRNDIHYLLRDLLKVIKVVSMYPEDNPLPVSLKRSFGEKLVSLAETYGNIQILVGQSRMSFEGDTVYEDKSKEEALAAIFFSAGITEITFKTGIELEEVYRVLDILKTYINGPAGGKDLAGSFWEAALSGFGFQTVEDIALSEYEGDFQVQASMEDDSGRNPRFGQIGVESSGGYNLIFEESRESNEISLEDQSRKVAGSGGYRGAGTVGGGAGGTGQQAAAGNRPTFYAVGSLPQSRNVFSNDEVDDVSLKTSEAAEAMGFADLQAMGAPTPDTAVIFNEEFQLSEQQEQQVEGLLAEDAKFEPYESTLALLKEMVLQETEMSGFYEAITICERVQTEFVKRAELAWAAKLLRFFLKLQSRLTKEKPLWAERVKDALVTAGSRDRLIAVAEALNENPNVSAHELRTYLECFDWESMSAITDLLGSVLHERHQETIADLLTERGKNHIEIISKGIYDKRPHVVRSAARILSRIGDDRALGYLEKAVHHEDTTIRLDIACELSDCAHEKALGILKTLVGDPDHDVRNQAVKSIVHRKDPAAFDTIADIINEAGFGALQDSDQQSLLNAYSELGGGDSVSFLVEFITRFNLTRSQGAAFFRKAAYEALILNKSEEAERALLKLASSWRPDVKRQATDAIRRRRELIYGVES